MTLSNHRGMLYKVILSHGDLLSAINIYILMASRPNIPNPNWVYGGQGLKSCKWDESILPVQFVMYHSAYTWNTLNIKQHVYVHVHGHTVHVHVSTLYNVHVYKLCNLHVHVHAQSSTWENTFQEIGTCLWTKIRIILEEKEIYFFSFTLHQKTLYSVVKCRPILIKYRYPFFF